MEKRGTYNRHADKHTKWGIDPIRFEDLQGVVHPNDIPAGTVTWDHLDPTASGPIEAAQSSADGKNAIHYSTSDPSGAGVNGDTWFKYGTGADSARVVAQYTHNGTAWVETPLTSAVFAYIDAGDITTGTLSAARITSLGNITATGTITGGTITTAAAGERVTINASSDNSIGFYSGLAAETARGYIACDVSANWVSADHCAPNLGSGLAKLDLFSGSSGGPTPLTSATLEGDVCSLISDAGAGISVGQNSIGTLGDYAEIDASVVYVETAAMLVSGYVQATGYVSASYFWPANYASTTSNDGIMIQDSNTTSRRFKLFYSSSEGRLYVSLMGGSETHYWNNTA